MAYQITLSIEDNSTLKALKQLIGLMQGVTILPQRKSKKQSVTTIDEYVPNDYTLKAMKDAQEGRTFRASSAANLIREALS